MLSIRLLAAVILVAAPAHVLAQGVTTSALHGVITGEDALAIPRANVLAVHMPSGTQYRTLSNSLGAYNLPNLRIGGPYRITVTLLGFEPQMRDSVFLELGQTLRHDFRLVRQAVQIAGVSVTTDRDPTLNAGRTGAATSIAPELVIAVPSIKRSTRDLTRLDPRSDGNFSFGGRNWLYNNISLDGSYFNNPFGLDDPAPGGQANAEPVPFEAVEQVQVSIAPFDVRQGGFTGANINTVTKSGTNRYSGAIYSFLRNDALQGNEVSGSEVVANPDLSFLQSGFSLGGPIVKNKLFFFLNAELERTDDPGSNFVANRGSSGFGVSRVRASTMDSIRARLATYGYETGPYEGYIHETNNEKLLLKLDWNAGSAHAASLRFNYLDATRDLPPHPFVLSFANTGRGPNESSLPFYNSGYTVNNKLQSYAFELNSRSSGMANRFFASYNRFRDHRSPFSADFPTIEIGEGGVTYTTAGHEPFSIHNILDQDVWQFTDNVSLFMGNHVVTVGANYESFNFFNSFNIFRHGVFYLPPQAVIGTTFSSLNEFFTLTNPSNPNRFNFNGLVGSGPFKGELIDVSQLSLYAQDEWLTTDRLRLTYGLRIDLPIYGTDPVDNPFSRGLTALDENRQPETVDQSKLPGSNPLFSPRVGFNWNARGNRETQLRGGTGIFTGRVPFVWVGNAISNPGANPNLTPAPGAPERPTRKGSTLQQSFDLNAMDPDFKFPQVWTTDLAIDQQITPNWLGTIELIYGKDMNAVFMRNADLVAPRRTMPDGRPYYGGAGNNELNPDGGAGIYVIDNTDDGYSFNATAQLRGTLGSMSTLLGYSYTHAKNNLKSTEIASVLWQNQPVQGDPNKPELSWSEFGQQHRIIGSATYNKEWSTALRTQVGLVFEMSQGNRFAGAGGNRYSFIYSGDVNGDGATGNDLIYIPRDQNDIALEAYFDNAQGRVVSVAEQRTRLEAFIEQDKYLREHRGEIAQRFGALNPWYSNVDFRVLQDFALPAGGTRHAFQLSLDLLNVGNLINSDWGVRKVASPAATSPLRHVVDPVTGPRFTPSGAPVLNFTGPSETFIDDPGLFSRWRAQIGLRYFFN